MNKKMITCFIPFVSQEQVALTLLELKKSEQIKLDVDTFYNQNANFDQVEDVLINENLIKANKEKEKITE